MESKATVHQSDIDRNNLIDELKKDMKWLIEKSCLSMLAPAEEKVTMGIYCEKCIELYNKYGLDAR